MPCGCKAGKCTSCTCAKAGVFCTAACHGGTDNCQCLNFAEGVQGEGHVHGRLFHATPPPNGQSRQGEPWEAPRYPGMFGAAVDLLFGLQATPQTPTQRSHGGQAPPRRSGGQSWRDGTCLAWRARCRRALPGDGRLTVQPEGAGPLAEGGSVSVGLAGTGTLANPVRGAAP